MHYICLKNYYRKGRSEIKLKVKSRSKSKSKKRATSIK